MTLTSLDRLLILAPHPDDESLATGALIHRAVRAGAKVRILFATDGDDNPWPQRFLERRFRVNSADRRRWGRRRRREALAAAARLGLSKSAIYFLALPDQGITDLLVNADEGVSRTVARELEKFRPTWFVIPSGADTHPDHSSLFVFAQLALGGVDQPPAQLRYLVHHPRRHSEQEHRILRLTGEEFAAKHEAIGRHETQIALSKKRFLSYAKAQETFYAGTGPRQSDAHHPVASAKIERGGLRVRLHLRGARPTFAGLKLLIALESLTEGSVRWILTLPSNSGRVRIEDSVSGEKGRAAAVRIRGRSAEIAIPVSFLQPLRHVFLKLQRRTIFLDDSGWREIPADAVLEPVGANPSTFR